MAEHPSTSGDPVLDEIRAARQDISILNVRLFGNEDGSTGEGGRIPTVEEKVASHGRRLTWLERIAYGAIGAMSVLEFLDKAGVIHFGK